MFNVANPDIFLDDITAVLLFNVVKPDTFIDDNNVVLLFMILSLINFNANHKYFYCFKIWFLVLCNYIQDVQPDVMAFLKGLMLIVILAFTTHGFLLPTSTARGTIFFIFLLIFYKDTLQSKQTWEREKKNQVIAYANEIKSSLIT